MRKDEREFSESPADTELAPTLAADGRRKWVYPDRRSGPRSRLRGRLAFLLVLIYVSAPWIQVHSLPLVRFDISGGCLYLGGAVLRFADVSWLAFAFVGLALTLFFATAARGRIWCGYACPQTVFVEWIIRPIEEFIEGKAHHRRRQDQGPWSKALVVRKALKHLLFLVVAAVVANTWMAYFFPPETVLSWMRSSPLLHPWAFLAMSLVLLAFYLDLAWFREQFCAFLCPYARVQTVMMDQWTPALAYDSGRGEPRGKKKSGDCIDCGLCQRVCPTGIDIRAGLQLECINCNRCADACDVVMGSLKRPLGLIRQASIGELQGQNQPSIWRRLRVMLYGLGMVAAFSLLGYRLWLHAPVSVGFSRVTGTTYSRLPDGRIANQFNLRTINETGSEQPVKLVAKTAGVEIICGSCEKTLPPFANVNHLVVVILGAESGKALIGRKVEVEHEVSGQVFSLPILLPE